MTTKPAFIAYTVKNRGKGKSAIWTKIGAAWPHTDAGFSVELEALPLDGRIVLREPKPEEAAEPGNSGD